MPHCSCGPVFDCSLPVVRPDWKDGSPSSSGCQRAGVLVSDSRGRLLLQQSYGNKWGVAKGAVRDLAPTCESPRHAAVRELAEETGFLYDPASLRILTSLEAHGTAYTFYEVSGDIDCRTATWRHRQWGDCESTAVTWVCSRCCAQKLRDRRGEKGLRAVNRVSRLLLHHVLQTRRNHAVCAEWGSLFGRDLLLRRARTPKRQNNGRPIPYLAVRAA